MNVSDKLQDIQDQFKSIDWSNVRGDNFGSWPFLVKLMSWVACLAVIVVGGYFVFIEDLQITRDRVIEEEQALKEDFKKKAFDAGNLDVYRQQMEEMSESFEAMVSQLPSDTEVPGLLEDITAKGVASGLNFDSINLEKEQAKEYYIQLPIRMKAEGAYHDIGAFVSGVAGLPRIVTLTDFVIRPVNSRADDPILQLEILAYTYRYNDKPEKSSKKSKKSKKKKKKKSKKKKG